MKGLLLIHIVALLIIGCGLIRTQDKTKDFIPGTYIRFSSHEYGKEYDTLVISLQNSMSDEYRIVRKWKYERVPDRQKSEPEYHKKESSAIYNPVHKLLQESETGRIYSIDVKENCLFNGPIKYQKL